MLPVWIFLCEGSAHLEQRGPLSLQPLAIFPLIGSNMAPSAGRLGQGKPLSTHSQVLSILARRPGHRLGLQVCGSVRCLIQLPVAFVWWLERGTIW